MNLKSICYPKSITSGVCRSLFATLLTWVIPAATLPAQNVDIEENVWELQELVVTAQKREQRLVEVSRNAEQDLLRERIQEQARLEIRKSTKELNISIEKHIGLYSDRDYISPAEEIALLTGEEYTGPIGPFLTVKLIAKIMLRLWAG